MRMETLKVKQPEAQNVTKARITAYSKEDAEKAAALLSKGWTHSQLKEIKGPGVAPGTKVYYVLLWN